jgi:hypothetical protein
LVDLGSLSFFRGVDSTGIATLTKKKPKSPKFDYHIHKSTNHAIDFFKESRTLANVFNQKTTSVLGHARAATHGTVNEINAHPVREGSIVGTHNGVVRKHAPDKKIEDTHTDSRLLFAAIDKGDLESVLKDLYGTDAYALAFYDLEYGTLNFVRNDKRPLYLCKTASNTIYWASEPYMLTFALLRNDLACDDLKQIPEDTLITLDLIDGEPDVKKLNLSRYTYSGSGSSHYTGYHNAASVLKPGYIQDDESPFKQEKSVTESHAKMIEHMKQTREDYIKGKMPAKSNVIVLPTKEDLESIEYVPTKLIDADTKILEDQLDQAMASLVKKANAMTTEVDQRESTFPRPASYYDRASYKLRRNGQPTWVSIPVAQAYLQRHPCLSCDATSTIEDVVHWKSPSEYLCEDCAKDLTVLHFMGPKMSEFMECDLVLDSHISMYGG